nr:hypothetical protein [Tanacetum cinerariifolium]
ENLGKLQPKADIGIFIGYAPTKKAFRIYNRRTRRIVETIHVDFDELTAMASEQRSSGPALNEMTQGTIIIPPVNADSTGSPSLTTVEQDAPSTSNSTTPTETQSLIIPQDVGDDNLDIKVAHMGSDPLFGIPIPEVTSDQPDGFVDPDYSNHVYKLKKALYGLKQAPRAWYDMLSSFLLSQDFSKGSMDPTLFIRKNGNDLLLMSMMGKISFFLGLQISQNPRGIFINKSKYALESLKKYGFESCDPVDTPMVEKSKLDKDKEAKAIDPSHYRGMIDTLLYLTASRLDLQFAICMCARAFLMTVAVPEIYMQEFWATTKVHQHSIRFKMDTKKHIVNLESFREMLHISPRVPGQSFAELPFEEEILEFLRFLGHSAQIKTLTVVNVNKLYQPWRSFAAVINKCLTGKSTGFDNLRDDIPFSTIKVVSRHQNTQQYGAILPIELTTEDIRNTKAYKEYYACATGEATPKPKASARKKKGGSASSTTPPTPIATPTPTTTVVAAPRLSAAAKGKQPARARSPTEPSDVERTEAEQLKIVLRRSRHEMHISQQGGFGIDEGTSSKPGVLDVPYDDSEEELSWNSFDDEDVDT